MKDVYILDTNAFFNYIKNIFSNDSDEKTKENMNKIKNGECYISIISTIEIISVLGKYARGGNGAEKPMKPKAVKRWIKLINDILNNNSSFLTITILPFDEKTIYAAKNIIQHSMRHNFGSLDSMIAATARIHFSENDIRNKYLVTSDKGLKACLDKCNIPYWDAFQIN